MYRRKYSTKFTEAGQPFVKGLAQLSPFMTIPELQAYLHICRRTAYTLVHQEGFPAYRWDAPSALTARSWRTGCAGVPPAQ